MSVRMRTVRIIELMSVGAVRVILIESTYFLIILLSLFSVSLFFLNFHFVTFSFSFSFSFSFWFLLNSWVFSFF